MGNELNLDELERLAKAATPQDIDAAEIIESGEGKTIECPTCSGEGYVSLEGDYCNFDGCAIGVQFYGIGNEHGAAERYYRAANPATVIELVRRLREAEEIDGVLIDALEQCRGRFAYYVQHHLDKGDLDKAAGNEFWVKVADDAIAKAQGLQPCQGHARQQEAEEIEQLRKDAERLNWLDATNRRFRMGWYAGIAPVGNVMISSVVMGTTDIRSAIDSAKADQEAKSGD